MASIKRTGGPSSSRISSLDANKPRVSQAAQDAAGDSRSRGIPVGAYYADDDSVVSSNVSDDGGGANTSGDDDDDPEVATLTRAVPETDPTEREGGGGILPRSRREWCIVILAITMILAVALGIGLGLGLYFVNRDDDGVSDVRIGSPSNPGNGDGESGDDDTASPNSAPNSPVATPSPLPPPIPDDFGSAIEYHVVYEEISDITSLAGMAGDKRNPNTVTAQDRARDFLVLRDYLPMSVVDEEDDELDGEDDDLLAVPSGSRRPYLTMASPAYRVAQRYSAAVLYYSTDGPNWGTSRGWLEPGVHECDFVGVSCEDLRVPALTLGEALERGDAPAREGDGATTVRTVVAIDLPENGMGGTLPRELAALAYLHRLGLWSNRIGGTLPARLGALTRLSELLLDDNELVGSIPSEIGSMAGLTEIFLDHNLGVEGRIPKEIGDIPGLERLRLSDMSLRGPIPTSLGRLTSLVDLSLGNNRLGRGLPEEIKDLVNLESLVLSGNQFTGDIPTSWRSLTKLKRLEIQSNKLSFDLDDESMCSLRSDDLEGNGLLEALVADCQGDEPKVRCNCCTACLP